MGENKGSARGHRREQHRLTIVASTKMIYRPSHRRYLTQALVSRTVISSALLEIARRLDISRNTVRRYIRSEAIEPSYPTRQSPSSLDEFAPRLSAWLSAEAVKSRKQRRTLKQMFLDLKELGYEGSYDRVAAFGRQWKVDQMARVNSASKSTPKIMSGSNWAIALRRLRNMAGAANEESVVLRGRKIVARTMCSNMPPRTVSLIVLF